MFIPDPNSFSPGSRIRIKEFKYFNPKQFLLFRIPDPGVKMAPNPGSATLHIYFRESIYGNCTHVVLNCFFVNLSALYDVRTVFLTFLVKLIFYADFFTGCPVLGTGELCWPLWVSLSSSSAPSSCSTPLLISPQNRYRYRYWK
jgi:hypothetical protein